MLACSCLIPFTTPCFAQTSSAAPASSSSNPTTLAAVPTLEELGLPSVPEKQPAQDPAPPQSAPKPSPENQNNLAAPPSSNGLSLQGLGFSSTQIQSNPQMQARLNKRTHMLKIHQELGLITAVPMLAAVIAGGGAKQHYDKTTGTLTIVDPSSANVDVHIALGSLTAAMYGATAYFAIFAPKVPGVKPRGAIRVHRALAFIHGPGMILTPILGSMALSQEEKGEKVHGIASAHAFVAWTTVVAYGASIVSVSWPIHLKFWEHP